MTEQFTQPLDSSISQCTDLLAVELFPSFAVELFEKLNDYDWIDEVDECVAHVALVLFREYFEVYWQVEEVIISFEFLVYCA